MIEQNIKLQIASIELYLLGFFFGVRSTFKGRFRSILAMIHGQSYLNMIAIESRMQEVHEELKFHNIFTIQSEVRFTKEEHRFL